MSARKGEPTLKHTIPLLDRTFCASGAFKRPTKGQTDRPYRACHYPRHAETDSVSVGSSVVVTRVRERSGM